jgi:hypothetical protein
MDNLTLWFVALSGLFVFEITRTIASRMGNAVMDIIGKGFNAIVNAVKKKHKQNPKDSRKK